MHGVCVLCLPFACAATCGVTCGGCWRGLGPGFDMNQWEREWNCHTGAFVDRHLPTWCLLVYVRMCALAYTKPY